MSNDVPIPLDLIEQLNKGYCVLFVGDELDGQSQSKRLATALADRGRLHGACPVPQCRDQGACSLPGRCALPWPRVAQLYQSQRGHNELVRFVRDFVEEHCPIQPVLPIFRAVAGLPAPVMITTAYDRRLEEALRQAGRRVNAVVKDANVPLDDPDRVQLIYLHGRLDQPDSLVLTSDDAADLFGRLPTVATILRGLFASRTLLFLGYGLADPHFETLYQQAARPIGDLMRRAYGVQWPADPLACDRWRGKIDLAQAEPLDYLKELTRQVRIQAQASEAGTLPAAPYKFLDYFTDRDQAIFFGRDLEADLLLSTVLAHRFSVFYGRSGAGKTSLLLARVGPKLKEQDYRVVYARMLGDPAAEVKAAVRGVKPEELAYADRGRRLVDVLADAAGPTDRLVIVLDQFEEFFVRQGEKVRGAFAQELRDCLWPTSPPTPLLPGEGSHTPSPLAGGRAGEGGLDLRVVLSLRDDYLGSLDELSPALPHDVFAHRYRIENLSAEKATLAIIKPAGRFGLLVEEALCRQLVADLEDRGVEPANLQIVLHELYQDAVRERLWQEKTRRGAGLTLARYRALGGTAAILAGYLDRVLAELGPEQQQQARTILKSMVTAQRTKAAVTGREIVAGDLVARLGVPAGQIRARLEELRNRGIVRKFGDEDRYELAHEVMVEKVWAWVSDAELRLLDVRDMLRRQMSDWSKFGHLLAREKLELVTGCCSDLALSAPELELLFRSSLAAGYEIPTWAERAHAGGAVVDVIALEGLKSNNFRTRAAAAMATALGQSDVRSADALIRLLADLYPQVRMAAIAGLERLRPDGAWRQYLKYECYVPAGEFIMGNASGASNQKPAHKVFLAAYYIGKYPVTYLEYQRFMADRGLAFNVPVDKEDHPVGGISWYDAKDYARWAEMRLPTEAEWEKAASWAVEQGSKGAREQGRKRKYPWGDEFDKNVCNTKESGIGTTTPVGKYSPRGDSPYGCVDMAGNVWEWCSSQGKSYPYRADDGREILTEYTTRVLRGGSFDVSDVWCTYRNPDPPGLRRDFIGFRVARGSW